MDFDEDYDYLDLDEILTHSQTINCRFLFEIPGLDFLSPGNDITEKTELLLPFWLAKTLYSYSIVDLILPKEYKSNFFQICAAEAYVVDLHKKGPYYYNFGRLLMSLRRENGNNLTNKYRREEGETLQDRRTMAGHLINIFHKRRHKILEFSTNPKSCSDVANFITRLDEMEKRLFALGCRQVDEIYMWRNNKKKLKLNI